MGGAPRSVFPKVVLFLHWGGGYAGVINFKNSLSGTHRCIHFSVCMLYRNTKFNLKSYVKEEKPSLLCKVSACQLCVALNMLKG